MPLALRRPLSVVCAAVSALLLALPGFAAHGPLLVVCSLLWLASSLLLSRSSRR